MDGSKNFIFARRDHEKYMRFIAAIVELDKMMDEPIQLVFLEKEADDA